jgi:hypothetical protein
MLFATFPFIVDSEVFRKSIEDIASIDVTAILYSLDRICKVLFFLTYILLLNVENSSVVGAPWLISPCNKPFIDCFSSVTLACL